MCLFADMNSESTDFIPDLPSGGPLDKYRKQAKFNWKKLKLIFEDAELLKCKVIPLTYCVFKLITTIECLLLYIYCLSKLLRRTEMYVYNLYFEIV